MMLIQISGPIMLVGNGGTTDLPFYIIPSEEGPFVQLSNPLSSLNPYTRSNGCIRRNIFLCDWVEKNIILRIQL